MKRFLSLLLVCCLALSRCSVALAASITITHTAANAENAANSAKNGHGETSR